MRDRRHVLDQAGQGGLGLVVGQPRDGCPLQAGHEHGHDEALHRLRRAPRARVHARRRGLGPDVGGRPDRGHPALPARGRRAGDHRPRQVEGRRDAALGRVAGPRPAHGRGHGPLREVGRGRHQGRLHEPRRPGDGQLLREGREDGRRASPDRRSPRRLQADRAAPGLPEPADARGRHGPRVQQVERERHAGIRRDHPLHPDAGRAHGLHARGVPQRRQGTVRGEGHRADVAGDAGPPAGHVRRLREPSRHGLRLSGGVRGPAGFRIHREGADRVGRNPVPGRRAGPIRRPGPEKGR